MAQLRFEQLRGRVQIALVCKSHGLSNGIRRRKRHEAAMATIIDLKDVLRHSTAPVKRQALDAPAKLYLFTGVRYERSEAASQPANRRRGTRKIAENGV